jgi:hypothetical protein
VKPVDVDRLTALALRGWPFVSRRALREHVRASLVVAASVAKQDERASTDHLQREAERETLCAIVGLPRDSAVDGELVRRVVVLKAESNGASASALQLQMENLTQRREIESLRAAVPCPLLTERDPAIVALRDLQRYAAQVLARLERARARLAAPARKSARAQRKRAARNSRPGPGAAPPPSPLGPSPGRAGAGRARRAISPGSTPPEG